MNLRILPSVESPRLMSQPDVELVEAVIMQVEALRQSAVEHERAHQDLLTAVHPHHIRGARNFLQYLGVRQHDLRQLQRSLASLGLSSLGRIERCTLASLDAVLCALDALAGRRAARPQLVPPTTFESGEKLLEEHARAVLGNTPAQRTTRVMVTLDPVIGDPDLERLLESGMDVARINCSKGGPAEWGDLIGRLRRIARETGRSCRVLCDLSGPNPRSAEVQPEGARVELVGGAPASFWLARDVAATRARLASEEGASDAIVVGCTIPEVIADLRPGQRVFYDDGKLAGRVRQVTQDAALVEVELARKGSVKIRSGKAFNFPDSELGIAALTSKDLRDLDFVAAHADLVGLSFLRAPSDVRLVQAELARRGAAALGLVLKIETTPAFRHFPRLLLTAMQSPNVAVMLARGDMAVEMGFVRLAEVQEELLWLCEAALIPTIWATQVLESLNKTGVPTRSEVTDAAMSSRAECVMLNQGENLVATVSFVIDVIRRMHDHQDKKRSLMRPLSVSRLD